MLRIYAPKGKSVCTVAGCGDKYYGSGFCKKHHQWHWKLGLLPKPKVLSLGEKIKLYSQVDTDTGCWLWTKICNNKGYGRISIGHQKNSYAHRISYMEFKGPITDGVEVCHQCDRPRCVNPDHLFLASHHDNMRDSARKGRNYRIPARHGVHHHAAKLKNGLLEFVLKDPRPASKLAEIIGCHRETILRARNGLSYKKRGAA